MGKQEIFRWFSRFSVGEQAFSRKPVRMPPVLPGNRRPKEHISKMRLLSPLLLPTKDIPCPVEKSHDDFRTQIPKMPVMSICMMFKNVVGVWRAKLRD